jgi:glycine cleavage system aminomethyltransferase T
MELSEKAKAAVGELGAAINAAIEKSARVATAVKNLRQVGYELELTLKLEIGLRQLNAESNTADFAAESDLRFELTDEDLQTLKRMKIRLE